MCFETPGNWSGGPISVKKATEVAQPDTEPA